jgi:hypothetical protein
MWSLPNIVAMNAAASSPEGQEAITAELEAPEAECQYCNEPATERNVYYDIFSDDPKGVSLVCDEHPDEDLFHCVGCERDMVDHYTWERYQTSDGLCINCARTDYLEEDDNWIDLEALAGEADCECGDRTLPCIHDVATVITDVEFYSTCPHLVAVGQELSDMGLEEIDLAVIDGSSACEVTGSSSTAPDPDSGLDRLREAVVTAGEQGYKRVVVLMTAAWQFCVNLSVIVEAKEETEEKVDADAA